MGVETAPAKLYTFANGEIMSGFLGLSVHPALDAFVLSEPHNRADQQWFMSRSIMVAALKRLRPRGSPWSPVLRLASRTRIAAYVSRSRRAQSPTVRGPRGADRLMPSDLHTAQNPGFSTGRGLHLVRAASFLSSGYLKPS